MWDSRKLPCIGSTGTYVPSAILFMASYEPFKETASRLKELFPDLRIGTIGTRLVNGQVNDSGLAVLGFFSDVKIRCGIITEASRCPVRAQRSF